jgi:hypothetical protein
MLFDKVLYLLRHMFKLPAFVVDFLTFKRGLKSFECRWIDILPMLNEKKSTMDFDAHYIYHTGWAARVLKELAPTHHVDISSALMFSAVISAYTKVTFYDFRKLSVMLPNLQCGVQDATHLTFNSNSIESLSCMHVLEHIGLGRYGDAINNKGDLLAAAELTRVIRPGGHLLIVVPVGVAQYVRFNAHRIYSYRGVVEMFRELDLLEFAFLNDQKDNLFTRFSVETDTLGSVYGCGCFLFTKPLRTGALA